MAPEGQRQGTGSEREAGSVGVKANPWSGCRQQVPEGREETGS